MRITALAGALLALGCGTPRAPATDASCPAQWVRALVGGCGPAVLVCVPDGGAAPGACDGVDLSGRPSNGDGGGTFFRLPDGAIGGPWHEPGEPGGPPAIDWEPAPPRGLPAIDWAPTAGIRSCPPNWPSRSDATCDPDMGTTCLLGAFALPGRSCTSTAQIACPSGAFADVEREITTGSRVVYVSAAADPAIADGTMARPFATIGAALRSTAPPDWVLVGAGEYTDAIDASRTFHVIGTCAASVTFRPPAGAAGVQARGMGVRLDLRGVTVAGGQPGVVALGGATLSVQRVRVVGATGRGFAASGAGSVASGVDVVIDDTRSLSDATEGWGANADAAGLVSLSRSVLRGNRRVGARSADPASSLALEDSVVRGTLPSSDGSAGYGVLASQGGHVTVHRCVVTDNANLGVGAIAMGSNLTITDSVVEETRRAGPELFDIGGISVTDHASLTAERVDVRANDTSGARADGPGSRLTIRASVVRDSRPRPGGTFGWGLGVVAVHGGAVDATGLIVSGNTNLGVSTTDDGSSMTIRDSIVRDTRARPGDESTSTSVGALWAQAGTTMNASHMLVENNLTNGAIAIGERAQLDISDSIIRGVTGRSDDFPAGFALDVSEGGSLHAARVRISDVTGIAASAKNSGSRLTLEDVDASGTHAPHGLTLGVALAVIDHASADVLRTNLVGHLGETILVAEADSRATLEDVAVRDTQPSVDRVMGIGLSAFRGGTIDGRHVLVSGGSLAGIEVNEPGSGVTLVDSVVRDITASRSGQADGIVVHNGGGLAASRVTIARTRQAGLFVFDPGSHADFDDGAIVSTVSNEPGVDGAGIVSQLSAVTRARRTVLADHERFGATVNNDGSILELLGCLIARPRGVAGGRYGNGVNAALGGTLLISDSLIADSMEMALTAVAAPTRIAATNVIVLNVQPSDRGFGFGAQAVGGAELVADRLAVVGAGGAALAALPLTDLLGVRGGSMLRARDVFVRDVRSSTIQVDDRGLSGRPLGRSVAYALHAGESCQLDISSGVATGGGYGFFIAGGSMTWRDGAITGQLDSVGAISTPETRAGVTLTGVVFSSNASEEVRTDPQLPVGSALPMPTSVTLPPAHP